MIDPHTQSWLTRKASYQYPLWVRDEIADPEWVAKYDNKQIKTKDMVPWSCPIHGVYVQRYSSHVKADGTHFQGCYRCSQSANIMKRFNNRDKEYNRRMSKLQEMIDNDPEYLTKHNYVLNKYGKLVRQASMNQDRINWYRDNVMSGDVIQSEDEIQQFILKWRSSLEEYLRDLCDDLIVDTEVDGEHVDFYSPSKKVAVDFVDFYHNSFIQPNQIRDMSKRTVLQNKYTHLTEGNGIRYISLFDEVWINRRERVKSVLKYAFVPAKNKYYARSTKVVELPREKAKKFLETYHCDGSSGQAMVYLGIVEKSVEDVSVEDILQCMTFSHMRMNRGKSTEYEIARMANKADCVVVGGTSKLINYFVKHWSVTKLLSYHSCQWFDGSGYASAGMRVAYHTVPSYHYISYKRNTQTVEYYAREVNQCHKMRVADPVTADLVEADQHDKSGKYLTGFEYAMASAWNEYGVCDAGNVAHELYSDGKGRIITYDEWLVQEGVSGEPQSE